LESSSNHHGLSAENRLEHKRLSALFDGSDKAHTQRLSVARRANEAGKVEARYQTVHWPPTENDWRQHLTGTVGLVVIPLRSDGTVLLAIDIDDYELDRKVIINTITQHKLPLIACRMKSGELHLFIFFREPVPAAVARRKLREIAAGLG
jgi:hypothetical protein